MELTHFGHSCLLLTLNGARILFDPGNFSHGFGGITGLDAIVITHQHPDHCDVAAIPELVAANPDAILLADPQTTQQLNADDVAGTWTAATPGTTIPIGSVTATVTGGEHAVIHPDIPVIANSAFLIGDEQNPGRFMHPGDSLFVPQQQVDVLALPSAAPWMKLSEAVDYLRAMAPRIAVPIHQAILSDAGTGIHYGRLSDMKADVTEFFPLSPEVGTTLG